MQNISSISCFFFLNRSQLLHSGMVRSNRMGFSRSGTHLVSHINENLSETCDHWLYHCLYGNIDSVVRELFYFSQNSSKNSRLYIFRDNIESIIWKFLSIPLKLINIRD